MGTRARRLGIAAAVAGIVGVVVAFSVTAGGGSDAFKGMGDDDPAVRKATIEGYARAGRGVLPDLLDGLEKEDSPLIKAGIAEAIGRVGIDDSAANSLKSLLLSIDPATRAGAIHALASSRPDLAPDELYARAIDPTEKPAIRAAAAAALPGSKQDASVKLAGIAKDQSAPAVVRQAAARALARAGTYGVEEIFTIAKETTLPREDRLVAVMALGDPKVSSQETLAALRKNKEAWLRAAVASAMGLHGAQESLEHLATFLTDAVGDVRLAALRSLIAIGGLAKHQGAVVQLLADPDVRVQAMAVEVLGPGGIDIAKFLQPTLVALLASPTFEVRWKAALALFAHGDQAGAGQMLIDAGGPNIMDAMRAQAAYDLITGKKK